MSVASEPYFAGPMQPNSQRKMAVSFPGWKQVSWRRIKTKDSAEYVWPNRPFQPLQSPPGHLNQQFPPPQPYSSAGYPVGYSGQASTLSNYHQELPAPSSHIPTGSGSAQRQNESRRCVDHPRGEMKQTILARTGFNIGFSPSIPRPFPPHSTAGTIPDQSIMTS